LGRVVVIRTTVSCGNDQSRRSWRTTRVPGTYLSAAKIFKR
jgi:hypothetical protein